MSPDDKIALVGVVAMLTGITIEFGPGWAFIAAGIICIYVGVRLEIKDNEPD
jgi:hypothetical protein